MNYQIVALGPRDDAYDVAHGGTKIPSEEENAEAIEYLINIPEGGDHNLEGTRFDPMLTWISSPELGTQFDGFKILGGGGDDSLSTAFLGSSRSDVLDGEAGDDLFSVHAWEYMPLQTPAEYLGEVNNASATIIGGEGQDRILLHNHTIVSDFLRGIDSTIFTTEQRGIRIKIEIHDSVEYILAGPFGGDGPYYLTEDLANNRIRPLSWQKHQDEILTRVINTDDWFYKDLDTYSSYHGLSTIEQKSDLTTDIGRLYTAAFGRKPDTSGLQYWVNEVNDPLVSYKDVSRNFVNSPEFSAIATPDSSSNVFVTALYQNVLSRAPDSTGLSYWTNQFDSGLQDRADILIGFANSAENVALYETLI